MPRCSDPNTCKYDRRLSRSCNGSHALFPSAVFFSLEVFSDNISPWYQASRACRRPPVCHSGATRSRISDNPPPPSLDGRSRVMVLLSEALLGAEDTDALDDDVDDDDALLQEFRRCVQATASGKTVQKLRAWWTAYYMRSSSEGVRFRHNVSHSTLEARRQTRNRYAERSFVTGIRPWRRVVTTVGHTHSIVRLQTRIRQKDGSENSGGFDGMYFHNGIVLCGFLCARIISLYFYTLFYPLYYVYYVSLLRLPRQRLPRPIYMSRAITPSPLHGYHACVFISWLPRLSSEFHFWVITPEPSRSTTHVNRVITPALVSSS